MALPLQIKFFQAVAYSMPVPFLFFHPIKPLLTWEAGAFVPIKQINYRNSFVNLHKTFFDKLNFFVDSHIVKMDNGSFVP